MSHGSEDGAADESNAAVTIVESNAVTIVESNAVTIVDGELAPLIERAAKRALKKNYNSVFVQMMCF